MDAGPNRGFELILQLQRGRRQLPLGPESSLLFVLRHSAATFGAVVTTAHSQGRCRRHKRTQLTAWATPPALLEGLEGPHPA